MSSVDNRLVKMTFDNDDFEKKAGTTLGTLDKLKQSLDFTGALRGMENIQAGANSVTFDTISEGIEALQNRFSVLGEFVHNTFSGIVSKAAEMGKSFAESLTITPMKEGFAEYELQMNSVQTIMASTGESVDTVNKYLDELNTYADKTIYSFSDMTQNIGKFTNAGVSLDKAVSAIQGVSNVAAVSGANANEASRAMYNFAQALSAGSVKLIDWKSIETANMGTVEFKQQLIDTALAMGTLVKEGDDYISTTTDANGKVSALFNSTKGFNESLSAQWMTTDVLVQTLGQYSTDVRDMTEAEEQEYRAKLMSIYGDEEKVNSIIELGKKAADSAKDVKTFSQLVDTLKESLGSGWTKSWQYVFGDIEEAKKLWTEVNDVLSGYINKSADARNDLLKGWAEGGGRTAIIDGLRNAFQALVEVMKPVKEAFDSIFPPARVQDLIDYSNRFKEFTAGLKPTEEVINSIKDTATNVFGAIKNGLIIIQNAGETVFSVLKAVYTGITGAINAVDYSALTFFTSKVAEFVQKLKPSETVLNNISRIVKGVTSVFKAFAEIALNAASAVTDKLSGMFDEFAPDGENFMNKVGDIGDKLVDFANKLTQHFNFETFSGGLGSITDAFKNFFASIRDGEDTPGIISKVSDSIANMNFGPFTDFINKIKDGLNKTKEVIRNVFNGMGGAFDKVGEGLGNLFGGEGGGLFHKVTETIKGFIDNINWDAIFKILSHIESFLATKALLNLVDFCKEIPDKLGGLIETVRSTPVDKITGVLDGIQESLSTWQKNLKALVLVEIGVALVEIAKGMKTLSEIPPERIGPALAAMAGGLTEVVIAARFMKKSNLGDIVDLWGLAQLIEKIGNALKAISEIQPDRLIPSVIAMGALMLEIGVTLRIMKGADFSSGQTKEATITLLALSIAMKILGGVLEDLSKIPFDQMVTGLIAVSGLMAGLTVALRNFPKDNENLMSGAAAVILVSIGIRIIAGAVEKLGSLSLDTLAKGLISIGLLIAGLVTALNYMPKENASQLIAGAFAIDLIAVGIRIIAGAVEKLGSLPLDTMIKGLASVGILLAELTAALRFMPDSASTIASAFAMDLMAIAINGLVGPVTKLGALDLATLAKGLGAIAALLGELTLSLRFMPDATSVLASSVAMNLMAAAINSLVGPVEKFGSMNLGQLAQGLIAVGGSLGIFVAALRLMPKETESLASSAALIGMAIAINLLAGPLERLGQMNLGELLISLAAIGGALAILGIAAKTFAEIKGLAQGVAAMMGMAIAVGILSPALFLLSKIEIGGLLIALGALAGTFAIFGIAAAALAPSTGVIIAFAAAVALTGIGLFALAAAIGAVASIINNSSVDISATFGTFLQALIDNVPLMGQLVAESLKQILVVIQEVAPEIGNTVTTLITTVCQTIIDSAPKIGEAAVAIITTLLTTFVTVLTENGGSVINAIVEFLTQLVESIAQHAPRMFEAALTFIQEFLRAVAEHIHEIVQAAIDIVVNFVNGVAEKLPDIIDAAFKLVIGFIDGLATAIEENHNALFEAVGHLLKAIVEAIIDGIGMIADAGGKLLTGEDGNGGLLAALGSFAQDIFNAGANLVQGFINGILSLPEKLWNAACSVAESAWNAITQTLDEHSPSRVTFDGGQNFTQGFINGIGSMDDQVRAASAGVAYSALEALEGEMGEMELYSPKISPVLDTDELGVDNYGSYSSNSSLPNSNSINGTLRADKELMRKYLEKDTKKNDDTQAILNAINGNKSKQDVAMEEFNKMKVVLDSGALVGHLAPALDEEMGTRQILAGRGVI